MVTAPPGQTAGPAAANSEAPPNQIDPSQGRDHVMPRCEALTTLVDRLGYSQGETLALCHQEPGAPFRHTMVAATAEAIEAEASGRVDTSNLWLSVNPVSLPEGYEGRGTAADVTRWAALYCDLDVKVGGLPSMEAARAVIDAVSEMLEHEPVALIESGHGLQPVWSMDPEDERTDLAADERNRAAARALMRRFGRLVAHAAEMVDEQHRGHVDSVFDLARVLRLPGSVNRKDPDHPVPTGVYFPNGSPLGVRELAEQLTLYGLQEGPRDRDEPGVIRSEPGAWAWAKRACPYAAKVIDGWRTDKERDPSQRHP